METQELENVSLLMIEWEFCRAFNYLFYRDETILISYEIVKIHYPILSTTNQLLDSHRITYNIVFFKWVNNN